MSIWRLGLAQSVHRPIVADLIAYAIMFAGLMILAHASGNRGAMLSACVLAAAWLVWCAIILVSGNYEPWQAGIAIDGLAAYILTMPGHGRRGRAIIASLYALQIAAHIAYGWEEVSLRTAPWQAYGQAVDAMAWLQIIGVGAWAGGDILHVRGRGVAVSDIAPHRRGNWRG